MTQPYVEYTGDGETVLFAIPFPYINQDDIRVELDGGAITDITFVNATTIELDEAPAESTTLAIFRDTDDSNLRALFTPGATIRAQDLNNNFYQSLYRGQEAIFTALQATTGEIPAGGITSTMLADGAVVSAKLADDAVTVSKIGPSAVDTTALAAESVTQAKLGSEAVTAAKLAGAAVTSAKLASNLDLPGSPTTTTAPIATNSTRIATTAYVTARVPDLAPTKTGGGASGNWAINITGNADTATNATAATSATTAANATKLATTRTLWGQNFDGTANVSGNLTDVGSITGSSGFVVQSGGSNTNVVLRSQGTGAVVLDPKTNGGSLVQLKGGIYRFYDSDDTYYAQISLPTLTANRVLTLANGGTILVPGTMVPTSLSVLSGNGMTGGGTLSTDRTLTLGTPGTLTTATTNAVTSTSHTHSITASPAHAVSSTYNAVGTYSLMQNKSGSAVDGGTTVSGSSLQFAKANTAGAFYSVATAGAGTWRNIGTQVANNEFGLFQRVS
jgi:hypothetical protein